MEDALKYVILPSHAVALCLLAGLILTIRRGTRGKGVAFLVASMFLYILFGLGPVSYWLLSNLEYRHPAFISTHARENVEYLVVLAGGAEDIPSLPISDTVNDASAKRLFEAMRLKHALPALKIIISGEGNVPVSMRNLLGAVGMPGNFIVDVNSASTYVSAVNLRPLLGTKPFLLVTSAGHMPRAMMAFTELGMSPLPAPTDFRSRENILATGYLPTPEHLLCSDLAIHEYAASAWHIWTAKN